MTALYTASWRALHLHSDQLGDVQVVRISRGVPKFWPEAQSFPAIDLLMPDGWMLGVDGDRFWAAYTAKLDRIGVDAIRSVLDGIGGPCALACFEADPESCHRGPRGFSGWWRARGETVEEILARTAKQPSGQLSLTFGEPEGSGRGS